MTATPEPAVLYEKTGPVARLTLNRPRHINAFNIQMRDELYSMLEAVRDDPDVRAIIVRGAGERGFCAGADLTEFGSAPSLAIARQVRWERDLWGLFLSIRKPLIAALHGHVIGSGVEIACLCDIRIASEDAVFRMPEVALGMVPAAGGTQTLPRVIGQPRALEMLLTNRQIDAHEARKTGLVHHVVPRETLAQTADAIAQDMAAKSPNAIAAIKQTLLDGADVPLHHALAIERRAAQRLLRA
jgi:enoyl-CoA hydratase/3-hydroxypropionyl-coenzyme A dehydratase